MNTLQRLLSNTALAFFSNIVVKASNSLLFIFIGRSLGPTNAGVFNLGITYYTVVFALSAWGLHELLVREIAPRRNESGRYLVNYLIIRLCLTTAVYLALLLSLRYLLPYQAQTELVIKILALAVFPEAIFSLLQALFEAHEQLFPPTLAATINSIFKLFFGLWFLSHGYPVERLVWVIPIGSTLGTLILLPYLWQLFRQQTQHIPAIPDVTFILAQLRHTPSFVIIHLFSLLDYQADAFLISLLLTETDVGWYGAAQTILLAFWMMPNAVRAAIYPLMTRYYHEDKAKLLLLYNKVNQYLLILILPVTAGTFIIAPTLIQLIFDDSFSPAIPVLKWSIWAVVFAFLNVPNARLMLIYGKQREASWFTGISMIVNVVLNLTLVPQYGIVGAAIARTIASFVFFITIYVYVQRCMLRSSVLPFVWRPLLVTLVMSVTSWQIRPFGLLPVILTGVIVYILIGLLINLVPAEDRTYWQSIYQTKHSGKIST